ncbi:MAG: DMT family transporter [Chloroflexi bacterium]|nr:DMT family transporter [Chloroflexota bacterium]
MTAQALPYILLVGFLFGSTLVASRFGIGQFHPFTYLGLRAVLASLGYGVIYIVSRRRRPWPKDPSLWRHATLLGILGTALPMACFLYSLQYMSSGIAAIFLTTGPAMAIFLAHFFLDDETLTSRKGIGVMLAVSGALLMALRGESGLTDVGRASPLGYGLMFVALAFGNGMSIYARKYMRQFDAFDVASIRMMVTAVAVMLFVILFVGIDLRSVDAQGYMVLVYAALVGNFAAMYLTFYNLKRFGVTASSMTDYVTPVVASLGGVLILDEQITVGMMVGIGLVALGIMLINWRRRAPKPNAV